MKRTRLTELLLLTRPYSWIDTILNVLVGLASSEGAYSPTRHASAAGIALLLWFSLNWISEAIQHDPGRKAPKWAVAVVPLLIGGAWSAQLGGGRTLPWLVLYAALVFLYPWKARNFILGPIGPVIRGLQTGTLFILGASLGDAGPAMSPVLFALILVQAARSLLADIRDVQTDRYELPKLIGTGTSKSLAFALLLAGTLVLPLIRPGHFEAHLILILMLFLLVVLPSSYSYELHFIFILTFALTKMALYTEMLVDSQHLHWTVWASAQVLLSVTYWHVPRRSNLGFRQRMDRAIRIVGGNGNHTVK